MLHGVEILNNAVKVTLGPKGRNVILDKSYGAPRSILSRASLENLTSLADMAFNSCGDCERLFVFRPPS